MNFDGLTLHKVVEHLKPHIIGKRLNNVYNPLKSEYNFHIRDRILLISISPNHGRMYFTDFVKQNPSKPSNFAMVMRKYVKKSIILNIGTIGYDRIVKMDFKGRGELGEERIISLYIEIMGKYSNMILVDGKRIIDSHRRIVTRYRKVLPNKEYIPFVSDKKSPDFYLDKGKFVETFSKSLNLERALLARIQGMSPRVSKLIVSGSDNLDRIHENYIHHIGNYLKNKGLYFTDEEVYPIEFPDSFYSEDLSKELEKLYSFIEKDEISRNKKHRFYIKIEEEIKKLKKDIENLRKDIEETQGYDVFRKYGELLQIYQSIIKDRNPILEDYETGEKIEVPLIERKNAIESSLIYFKKYNKYKRRREILSKRIEKLQDRLKRANDILLHVELASTDDDLKDLELEFREFGIEFKVSRKKKKANQKKALPTSSAKKYRLGKSIFYVGKNSFQNEQLYRNSPRSSIWFHAKNIPSSHGILIGDFDDKILKTAAEIVAYHSRARLSSKVQIDYTELSNVYKPKGAVKGFVLYRNFKTVTVDPDEHKELLEK